MANNLPDAIMGLTGYTGSVVDRAIAFFNNPGFAAASVMAQMGAADSSRSSGAARIRYEDGIELIENDWTDISTAWTGYDSSKMSVASGVFRSEWDTGEGTPSLYRTYVVPATKSIRLCGVINVVASPAASADQYTVIGVQVSASAPSDYSNFVGIGVNEQNKPCLFDVPGVARVPDGAAALAAGVYYVTIYADENSINFSILNSTRTVEYFSRKDRSTTLPGTMNLLMAINTDSRKSSGNTIGAVFAKSNHASARSRADVTAEGVATHQLFTRPLPLEDDTLRVELPPAYDSRMPFPLVLFCHGGGHDASDIGNSNTADLVRALATSTYGYITASPTIGSQTPWGYPGSVTRLIDAYRYMRDHFNIGPVLLLGASQGFLTCLTALAGKDIPCIAGVYGMYPVTSLRAEYDNPTHTSQIESVYDFEGEAEYAAATAGYDPQLRQGWEFRGVRIRTAASPGDTVVSKATNSDLFLAKLLPYVPEATNLTCTGEHGAVSQTSVSDVNSFFQRCLGQQTPFTFTAATSPWISPEQLPWRVDIDPFMTPYNTAVAAWTTAVSSSDVYCAELDSDGTQNGLVDWLISPPPGTYTLEVMFTKNTSRGIMKFQLDDGAGTFATLGTIDAYNGSLTRNNKDSLTGLAITGSTRRRVLRVLMDTKNASASSYIGSIQHITLRRIL